MPTTPESRQPLLQVLPPEPLPEDAEPPSSGEGVSVRRGYGATNTAVGDAQLTHGNGGGTFNRNLGAIEAFAIVVSIVIGSGVFTSPGSIDANVPSPGAALVVWLVGGLLAWTGASTLTELGTAIPGEGGIQPYLGYIFGDILGFLAAWTWVVAVMPATLAILSIAFVESIFSAIGDGQQQNPLPTGGGGGGSAGENQLSHKLLSVLVLVVTNAANSLSTRASTRLNNFFVATKFAAIAGVVVAGVVVVIIGLTEAEKMTEEVGRRALTPGGGDWKEKNWFKYRDSTGPDGRTVRWRELTDWEVMGHYSAALYGALWAYAGWDKAIYITAELSDPARQLPRAINWAIPTIVLCFVATNAAYYVLLPWDVISKTDSVAVTAITRLLGPVAGIVAAVMVCLVVAGSLLGNSFVASRMAVAAANRGWLPRLLSVVGRFGRPKRDDVTPDDISSVQRHQQPEQQQPEEEEVAVEVEVEAVPLTDATLLLPKRSQSDAPLNALLLSIVLSTVYILLGNFRALLTFNGLGEYSFFFVTVVGAIILRFREPGLHRPYKPFLVVPTVFVLVSGFVVGRGAVFAPIQAAVLAALWIVGIAFYMVRRTIAGRAAAECENVVESG